MTSNTAPSPNFTGINFNTDFFPSALGDFVEYPVAQGPTTIATLYSSGIDTLSAGTAFNLLNTLAANLNIATNGTFGQTIRIGATTGTSVHCANIDHQGNSINNSTNASGGTINLCNNMIGGILNIGTNIARTGNINIGNGVGASGYIDIGNVIATTRIGGPLESTGLILANGNIKTATLDCNDTSAGTTALSIGPNAVNGNIVIGAQLGVGDVSIGGTQSAGGTITLGSANTVINSSVGVLSGNTAFSIVSASFTIPSSINRDYYIFCNANAANYTITMPARLVNQVIHFRNFSGRTLTITCPTTSPTTALYPAGFTTPFATSWTGFLTNTVQTFYCDGTNWLGF
jgi:hypothetical protein